jgi:hypothetical protein
MVKEKRSAADIEHCIMYEVRRLLPQCREIIGVKVRPCTEPPGDWTAEFDIEAVRSGPWPVPPQAALDKIVRHVRDQFDLV